MRPQVDVLKAIGRLQGNPDFEVFRKWLAEESQQATRAVLTSSNPQLIFRDQGCALTLADLVAVIDTAKPALAAMPR